MSQLTANARVVRVSTSGKLRREHQLQLGARASARFSVTVTNVLGNVTVR